MTRREELVLTVTLWTVFAMGAGVNLALVFFGDPAPVTYLVLGACVGVLLTMATYRIGRTWGQRG
jgi:hypothetical protein